MTFTGAGSRGWVVDEDCVLVQANSSVSTNFVVSWNPSLATTDLTVLSAAVNRFDVMICKVASNPASTLLNFELAFPLSAGKTIYVAVSSSSAIILYLNPVVTVTDI